MKLRGANPDRGDQTIADLEARNDGPGDEEVAMLTAYRSDVRSVLLRSSLPSLCSDLVLFGLRTQRLEALVTLKQV
jgi:hypothetical protein